MIIFIEIDLELYLIKYMISRLKSTAIKYRGIKVTHLNKV